MKKHSIALLSFLFLTLSFSGCSANKNTVTKIDTANIGENMFVSIDLSEFNGQEIELSLSADILIESKNKETKNLSWKVKSANEDVKIFSTEYNKNFSEWISVSEKQTVSIDSEKACLYLDLDKSDSKKPSIYINNFSLEIKSQSGEPKTFTSSALQANNNVLSQVSMNVENKSNWILDILFTSLGFCSLVLGLIGAFLPVLPGPPLAWLGLLLSFFSSYNRISIPCLIITAIIATIVTIIDTFMPTLMTKKFGGSKAATRGCTIGVFVGMFIFPPLGIIIGPFVGALIGEAIHTKGEAKQSFKSALGSFLGFISGCGLKFVNGLAYVIIFFLTFFYSV